MVHICCSMARWMNAFGNSWLSQLLHDTSMKFTRRHRRPLWVRWYLQRTLPNLHTCGIF